MLPTEFSIQKIAFLAASTTSYAPSNGVRWAKVESTATGRYADTNETSAKFKLKCCREAALSLAWACSRSVFVIAIFMVASFLQLQILTSTQLKCGLIKCKDCVHFQLQFIYSLFTQQKWTQCWAALRNCIAIAKVWSTILSASVNSRHHIPNTTARKQKYFASM